LHYPCIETAGAFAILGMDRLNPGRGPLIYFLSGSPPDFFVSRADVCHPDRFRCQNKKYLTDVVGQLPELLFARPKGIFRLLALADVASDPEHSCYATLLVLDWTDAQENGEIRLVPSSKNAITVPPCAFQGFSAYGLSNGSR